MIYQRIRDLREDNGFSQAQIAALIGVAQNTYSQYETGKISWTAEVLVLLSSHYHVRIDYLLGLTNNPARNR